MNNYDKIIRIFLGEVRNRIDFKIFCVDYIIAGTLIKRLVFVGFRNRYGGIRGIYSCPPRNEYLFGTLFEGQSIEVLHKLTSDGIELIPDDLKALLEEVYQTQKPLSLVKGKPVRKLQN